MSTKKIYYDGNVGIGMTNPGVKLDIRQQGESDGLRITKAGNTQEIRLHLADHKGGYGYFKLGGDTVLRGNGSNSSFDGNVGIGTSKPEAKLDVNGDVRIRGQLYIKSPTHVDTHGNTPAGWYRLSYWGSGSKRNVEFRYSDFRLKEEVKPLTSVLEKVFRLNPVAYKWNEQGLLKLTEHVRKDFISETGKDEDNKKLWKSKEAKLRREYSGTYKGFIAQELETVFPEWVQEGEDGYKTIDTSELTAVLVEALKELKDEKDTEIDSLKEENKRQKELLNIQQQQLSDLSAKVEELLRK